jgi:tetratricopeptide (TPR) repeat protein
MGTESSPTVSSKPARTKPRSLWQVPVFLIGVAVLAAAWVMRAPADSGPRQVARQLARARQILSRPDGDADAAAEAAQHALDVGGPDSDRAGEAYFLLGTARMRQGDHTPGEDGRSYWLSARHALEEAERIGVPADDQGHLRWRLAKVCYHCGDDPKLAAERLAASVAEAEDGAEAYDLLSQAYLRQTPPDYQKALDANTKLRDQSILRDDMLAKVKLRSGELKLKLGRAEEARKDLELIGPAAPAAILSQARLLRARSYQDESKWAEAAALWQAALNDSREPLSDRTEILYLLGVCHRRLDQVDDAIKAWDECVRGGTTSNESVAAAIQLAALRLDRKEFPAALALLASAADRVQKPEDWNNPYVDRAHVTEIFEKSAKALREAGQYEMTLQLADHYQRLAPATQVLTLRAEAATEWAKKRKAQPTGTKLAPEEEKAIGDLLSQAGTAYIAAAATVPEEARADLLWQAAERYFDGLDLVAAASTLEQFLKVETRKPRLGEAWYLLGETRRQANALPEAEAAYVACLAFDTRFKFYARYQLALLYSKNGQLDDAVTALEKNLSLLRFEPDPEALEKSLYELGNVAYKRHDYGAVVKRLEEALGQFPANPDQTRARYQLADSYRQLAADAKRDELLGDSPNPEYNKHLREKHRHFLQKAADEYQELAAFLEKPESAGHLTPEERRDIPFTAAQCRFDLRQYAEALALYERLIEAKISQEVTLQALGCAARCYMGLHQDEKMHHCVDEIRKALASLDKTERERWEEWLSLATKQAPH